MFEGRIENAVKEYKRRYRRNGVEAAFYVSDIYETIEIAKRKAKKSNPNIQGEPSLYDILYDVIWTAERSAFIIGYRKAQRDAKEKRNKAKNNVKVLTR